MAQTKYDVTVADANEFEKKTENVKGVKFINVAEDGKSVTVTHGDDFDEAAFKAAAGI